MIYTGDPIDPGTQQPDLNFTDSRVFSPGTSANGPIPTAGMTPQSNSLMFASMGISAISAIGNAFSQSRAFKAQGDYEAGLARTNSAIASLQSKQTLEAGDAEASRKNMQTQQQVGAERAAQGASGVDVASGSSALVRNATASVGAIDELTIRNNAARQAWGYQTEAIQDTYKGQFAQLTAKAQSQQSLLTGGLEAISGPLGIYAKYKYLESRFERGSGSLKPFPEIQ